MRESLSDSLCKKQLKNHIMGHDSDSTRMDPRIWRSLPPEILDQVLSFLPLRSFLNLRSTCKHFNSLIYSPSFVLKHTSASSFPSFLLLSHPHCHQQFPLYDSVIGNWRNSALSLPQLLPKASQSSLISASNGLFCFSLPSSSSFLVCNLLTKSSRKITFPAFPFAFELLTFVSTPHNYIIFFITSMSARNTAFLYDSRFHSWKQFTGFDPILSDTYHQEGVYFDGCLYFTTSEPFSVTCFDPESGKLEGCDFTLPNELTFLRLVSNGDKKLYLVGGFGANGISRGMKVWVLCERNRWNEVESLPETMCKKLMSVCYHNYEHVYCFWHQGMICICCYTWPEILYYKVSRKTWHWLPKSPSLPEKWSCGFKWFSFLPEISAVA